jgi:hypothetical protein
MQLLLTVFFVGFLFFSVDASSQTACFSYNNGQTISCDGPNLSNRTITKFSESQGVITDERGNLEPYTIIGADRDRDRDSDAQRRALIYGEDRRDRHDSRSRYGRDDDGR